jgi:7-cyano-7-deazaguanine synthase
MKSALLFSGGLDSTVVLGVLLQEGHQVYPIAINDGSPLFYTKELPIITAITTHYGLIDNLIIAKTMEFDKVRSNDEFGYMPGYKMILQYTAMSYCAHLGIDNLHMGYNTDNSTYKDEWKENIDSMTKLFNKIYDTDIKIVNMFRDLAKSEMIKIGRAINVPFSMTSSCDSILHPGIMHCGNCKWCQKRREAFVGANLQDPTFYCNHG